LTPRQVSWCKFEVTVDCPKDISVLTTSTNLEVPTFVVGAVNLKTIINEKHNVHEIVSASLICCHRVKVCCLFGVEIYFLAFDLLFYVL
jgi:DNA polymerase alpha subunit A